MTMATVAADTMTARDDFETALREAFAAVGRACDARLRAGMSEDEARQADMRLGNLAMMHAEGLGPDGCTR